MQQGIDFPLPPPSPLGLYSFIFIKCYIRRKKKKIPQMDHMLTSSWYCQMELEHYVSKFPGWELCLPQWCFQFGELNVLWRKEVGWEGRSTSPTELTQNQEPVYEETMLLITWNLRNQIPQSTSILVSHTPALQEETDNLPRHISRWN